MKNLLVALMATITQKPRYMPVIEWSSKSWTHNAFRLWELAFGRRVGVRPEMTSGATFQNGRIMRTYQFHTFEAIFAHIEGVIRNRFERLVPSRVYFPRLATVGPLTPSPFGVLMAVAYDAVSVDNTATTSLSTTHTCTGSDRLITAGGPGRSNITAVTYNSVSLSLITSANSSGIRASIYSLLNPASGANTLAMTVAAAQNILGGISFSGAGGTSGAASNTGSSTTASLSVTSSATSFAVDCMSHGDSGTPTATGSGQVARYATFNTDAGGGSTIPGAASVSFSWTRPGSSVWAVVGVSVDQVVAQTTNPAFLLNFI